MRLEHLYPKAARSTFISQTADVTVLVPIVWCLRHGICVWGGGYIFKGNRNLLSWKILEVFTWVIRDHLVISWDWNKTYEVLSPQEVLTEWYRSGTERLRPYVRAAWTDLGRLSQTSAFWMKRRHLDTIRQILRTERKRKCIHMQRQMLVCTWQLDLLKTFLVARNNSLT